MRREGFVLPLVLVGGFMLALLVISFHFVSASDTRSVARMERGVQAALLADLASDEVAAQVASITLSNPSATPQWVTDLLTELAAAHAGGPPPYAVKSTKGVTFDPATLPLTQKAAKQTVATLTLKNIEGKLGPFQVGSGWDAIYGDKLFDDQSKDLKACDLRGPLSIAITVAGDGGPFEFGQTYLRGQELVLTDTTPLASEFALFSFLPPPSNEYALTDMQAGGSLVVNPSIDAKSSARVLLRGPLVIVPEEAPAPANKPFLGQSPGDKVPPVPGTTDKPVSYPDDMWVGALAAIPGPRVLQHTDAGSVVDQALGGIKQAFDGAAEGISARRPENDQSQTKVITKPFEFEIVVTLSSTLYAAAEAYYTITFQRDRLLGNNQVRAQFGVPQINWQMQKESLILSNNFGPTSDNATFETLDRDPVAYYPPSAFLYGALPNGKQKFRFMAAGPSKTQDYSYCGVRVPYPNQEPVRFDRKTNIDLKEGDLVTLEPVPRQDKSPQANAGLIAAYGVAVFEARTLVTMPIRDFCMWMMQKFIDTKVPSRLKDVAQANINTAADQTLIELHLSPALTFLIRRFGLQAKFKYTTPDALEADLKSALGDKSALLAPYGGYFQDVNFWKSVVPPGIFKEMRDALRVPVSNAGAGALVDLLPAGNQPNFTPNFSNVDANWPATSDMPTGETVALKFRDWLTDTYMLDLLRPVMIGQADKGTTALDNMLRLVKKDPPGITPPALDVGKRPKGVLDGYFVNTPPAVDLAAIAKEYKGGLFPPQYRNFDGLITRRYATMTDLANAQTKNGVLELKGVALVETMDFSTSFNYRGRGIIVCTSSDPKKPAKLTGTIKADPADPKAMLIVVHRVAPALLAKPGPPQLQLGPNIEGSIYSDSGVAPPTGGTTVIKGNLVCGLLAKHATDPGSTLEVVYDPARMASPAAKLSDRWTVEMTGEVSSTQP